MVKKFIRNLVLSKASGADYISVVVLKNCKSEFELSYMLAECMSDRILFSRLIEGFIGQSLYLKMLGKGLQLKAVVLLVFFL